MSETFLGKKKTNRKPTVRQQRAVKLILENIGAAKPKTQEQILLEAGYSPTIAHNLPMGVTESDGFKLLMEKHLPAALLTRKHEKLLNQKQLNYFTFAKDMSDEEITGHVEAAGFDVIVIRESDKGKLAFYSIDDANAIKSGLDMGYKLRGSYAPEKSAIITWSIPDEEKKKLDDILNDNSIN